jgi:hypothetical protein
MKHVIRLRIQLGLEPSEVVGENADQDNFQIERDFMGQMGKDGGPLILEDENVQMAVTRIFMVLFQQALVYQIEEKHIRASQIVISETLSDPTRRN